MEHKPWLKRYDKGVPHSLEPYPKIPLFGFVEQAACEYPNNTALIFKLRAMKGALDGLTGGRMTYRSTSARLRRASAAARHSCPKRSSRLKS